MNKGKTFNETNLFTPIKLETHPLLEGIETTLNIGGVVCPFSALLGLGVGLYNKNHTIKPYENVNSYFSYVFLGNFLYIKHKRIMLRDVYVVKLPVGRKFYFFI